MNRVINAAAHGITTSSFHSHFQDVNPIRKAGKDWKEEREKTRRDLVIIREQRMKYDAAIAGGARVLPVIRKV